MTREFTKWLRDYDSRRTDPDRQFRMPSSWHSSNYDIENMDWNELRDLYIPELQMCWGPACEAMRKSWFHYKMLKKEGDRGWDIILRINRIQRGLGLEMTEFRDGPDLSWVKQQLDLGEGTGVGSTLEELEDSSSEDLELRYEEENQDRPWTDGTEEMLETGEDPEYAILRQEEREAALADIGLYPEEKDDERF